VANELKETARSTCDFLQRDGDFSPKIANGAGQAGVSAIIRIADPTGTANLTCVEPE
jgi:hypothetical protein